VHIGALGPNGRRIAKKEKLVEEGQPKTFEVANVGRGGQSNNRKKKTNEKNLKGGPGTTKGPTGKKRNSEMTRLV